MRTAIKGMVVALAMLVGTLVTLSDGGTPYDVFLFWLYMGAVVTVYLASFAVMPEQRG